LSSPRGSYAVEGELIKCPPGTYGSDEGLTDNSCSGLCEKGHFCKEGSVSLFEERCPSGRYGGERGLKGEGCTGLCEEGYFCGEGSISKYEHECGGNQFYCPQV